MQRRSSVRAKSIAEPIRSFEMIPELQTLFPDLTIRNGLAISYTLWLRTPVKGHGTCL